MGAYVWLDVIRPKIIVVRLSRAYDLLAEKRRIKRGVVGGSVGVNLGRSL